MSCPSPQQPAPADHAAAVHHRAAGVPAAQPPRAPARDTSLLTRRPSSHLFASSFRTVLRRAVHRVLRRALVHRVRTAVLEAILLLAGAASTGRRFGRRATPRGDAGMATAEYAVVTVAAVGFAGLLVALLRSAEVRDLLAGIIRRALSAS